MLMALALTSAITLACLGFGGAVLNSRLSATQHPAGAVVGLTGFASLTWIAGWFVAFGVYSQEIVWALLALGVGALLVRTILGGWISPTLLAKNRGQFGALLFVILSLAIATARIMTEFPSPFVFNRCDDFPAYFHFPRLLIESGGFVEPFSLRRLSALGAAQFTQSLFWRDFTVAANGIADATLGQLLLWTAAREIPNAASARTVPAWIREAFALSALLLALVVQPFNGTPTLLPLAGTVALLLLTMRLLGGDTTDSSAGTAPVGRDVRLAVGWGLIAAWMIGMRINSAPFVSMLWFVGVLAAGYRKDLRQGRLLAVIAVSTGLGLLPWSLALWQSSGTPMFPLIAGNYGMPGLNLAPLDFFGVLAAMGDGLWANRTWVVVGLGVLAALRPGLRVLSVQIVAASLVLVIATTATSTGFEAHTPARYCAPFLVGSVIFLVGIVVVQVLQSLGARVGSRGVGRGAAELGALLLVISAWLTVDVDFPRKTFIQGRNAEAIVQHARKRVRVLRRVFASSPRWWSGDGLDKHRDHALYVRAQSALPPDARIVSAASKPFHFRFDRQMIHTLDIFGAASPAPGIPFFEGPEKVAQYFVELGYTHLIYSPPGAKNCLYSIEGWTKHLTSEVPYLRRLAPHMLDFMGNAVALHRSRASLFESREVVVLDLRRSRPPVDSIRKSMASDD